MDSFFFFYFPVETSLLNYMFLWSIFLILFLLSKNRRRIPKEENVMSLLSFFFFYPQSSSVMNDLQMGLVETSFLY